MRKLFNLLKKLPGVIYRGLKYDLKPATIKHGVLAVLRWFKSTVSFLILLISYLAAQILVKFARSRLCPKILPNKLAPPMSRIYAKILAANRHREGSINRINLIELSLHNMRFKFTRTAITIGGMTVGIASIVFLVSIGFGLQELVISRVARLEEMKQADIHTQPGSNQKLTDETLADFKQITNVKHALPLIALVGKVNYKNSVSDMAVYGVTTEYLKQSAIQPIRGAIFDSNSLSSIVSGGLGGNNQGQNMNNSENNGEVAGLTTVGDTTTGFYTEGDPIGDVELTLFPNEWIRVRERPSLNAPVIGYTKRVEGTHTGREVWGAAYPDSPNGKAGTTADGEPLGKWVESKVYLWEEAGQEYAKLLNDLGQQEQKLGYMAKISISTKPTQLVKISDLDPNSFNSELGQVLGLEDTLETTETTQSTSAFEGLSFTGTEWVLLEDSALSKAQAKKVDLAETAVKQAVVNRAMLNILGVEEKDAINQTFEVSFIVTTSLLQDGETNVESNPATYTIVGVIPQDDVPYFYVPFIDLRGLGVANYSQVKIVTEDKNDLAGIRQQIEAKGYVTNSVTDTVEQINRLFATLRTVLALIGTVALGVAALGMFNTMTVSLLERTREIGLMKAMGMKSFEVKELFLTESMIMGFFGGLLGLFLGALAGELLGLIISIFAIAKGVGYIDIAHIPPAFIILIIALSLIVGIVTGIYPARRATKTSALNALRYE